MNVFMKNGFRVAGLAILLGIVLSGIAFTMDNSVFDNWENFNITFGNNNLNSGSWTDRINFGSSDREDKGSFSIGDKKEENPALSTEELKDIKSLSLDISIGTVTIKEGNSFDIEVEGVPGDEIIHTVKDGVWDISDNGEKSDNDSEISIFGIRLANSGSHPFKTANIRLTIPEDFTFDDLDIILGAGTIKTDKLTAENVDIEVGTGSLRIKSLLALEESSYSIDTGELIIDELNAHDANINCGVGNLSASGSVTGDSYVTCGIGNVDLNIDGNEEDYNYHVDCGIGTVIINNNSYSGVNSKTWKNNNAENSFTLNCGIGKISLKIH